MMKCGGEVVIRYKFIANGCGVVRSELLLVMNAVPMVIVVVMVVVVVLMAVVG